MPEVTRTLRPWVCALPQPGWGGATLADYVREIGNRPDAHGSEEEVAQILDALVASGHAQTVEVGEGEEPRWELTDEGHDALVAPIDPGEGATPQAVMLELQPGVTVSSAQAEAG